MTRTGYTTITVNITRTEECWKIEQLASVPVMQDALTVPQEDSETRECNPTKYGSKKSKKLTKNF